MERPFLAIGWNALTVTQDGEEERGISVLPARLNLKRRKKEMKISLRVNMKANAINDIERQIEELNVRTEIGRAIEKLGYKDYEIVADREEPEVILD